MHQVYIAVDSDESERGGEKESRLGERNGGMWETPRMRACFRQRAQGKQINLHGQKHRALTEIMSRMRSGFFKPQNSSRPLRILRGAGVRDGG